MKIRISENMLRGIIRQILLQEADKKTRQRREGGNITKPVGDYFTGEMSGIYKNEDLDGKKRFHKVDFGDCEFVNCDLSGAVFTKCTVRSGINFGLKFNGGSLQNAKFINCNIPGTFFKNAVDLSGAEFDERTTINGSVFGAGAEAQKTTTSQAVNLQGTKFDGDTLKVDLFDTINCDWKNFEVLRRAFNQQKSELEPGKPLKLHFPVTRGGRFPAQWNAVILPDNNVQLVSLEGEEGKVKTGQLIRKRDYGVSQQGEISGGPLKGIEPGEKGIYGSEFTSNPLARSKIINLAKQLGGSQSEED